MKSKFLLVALLSVAASPSLAADLPMAPAQPAVAPITLPFNWSGFYVGADIGYSWVNANVDIPAVSTSPNADGVVGGLYVGYNAEFNKIVIGIEADAEAASNSGDNTKGLFTGKVDESWQGSVRGRVGYAFDNVLPYVTGGFAWSNWDTTITVGGIGAGRASDTFFGWTVG